MEQKAYFRTLNRPIPSRVAGTLLEYAAHPEEGKFTCRWKEEKGIAAPTIIYLTEAFFKDRVVRIEPAAAGYEVQAASDNSGNVYLSIPTTGESLERVLTVE